MKMKIVALSFFLWMFLMCPTIMYAQDADIDFDVDLDVVTICPSSVGVGESVTIGLQITNSSLVPVSINKSALVLMFSNATILGPFTIPFNLQLAPGQATTISNYMTYTMPQVPGTVVGHGIVLCGNSFSDDCWEIEGCAIEVLR